MMKGNQTLISALQLRTRDRDFFKALADKKITGIALKKFVMQMIKALSYCNE